VGVEAFQIATPERLAIGTLLPGPLPLAKELWQLCTFLNDVPELVVILGTLGRFLAVGTVESTRTVVVKAKFKWRKLNFFIICLGVL
jgi:hypothetical protein